MEDWKDSFDDDITDDEGNLKAEVAWRAVQLDEEERRASGGRRRSGCLLVAALVIVGVVMGSCHV